MLDRVSETIPRKYIVIIGLIAAAIFAVIFFSNEDKSLDTYLLGGFIITQVLLFMVDQIFQNIRETRNDLKEHTKSINEVYKRLTLVSIEQGRWREPWKHFLKFPKEYKSLTTQHMEELLEGIKFETLHEDHLKYDSVYDYYESAIEHLKHKYKHIYKHWENTKNRLDKLNSKTSIQEKLEDRIKEKMDKYFPDFKNNLVGLKYYSTSNILQFIMDYFKNVDNFSEYALKSLDYNGSNEHKVIYSNWKRNDIHMGSDSDIDFEKYTQLVTEIVNDDSLKNFYHEYGSEHDNILKELECFREKLEKIVKDLKIRPLIKGKCNGCP